MESVADEPGELPGGGVAYIDNLERVTDASARELLEWFLLGLPGDSRLLLASQQSPGALLQQARLQGRLDVVDPTDLRKDPPPPPTLCGITWRRLPQLPRAPHPHPRGCKAVT